MAGVVLSACAGSLIATPKQPLRLFKQASADIHCPSVATIQNEFNVKEKNIVTSSTQDYPSLVMVSPKVLDSSDFVFEQKTTKTEEIKQAKKDVQENMTTPVKVTFKEPDTGKPVVVCSYNSKFSQGSPKPKPGAIIHLTY